MMRFPFVLAAVSFVVAFLGTRVFRHYALRWGLVDRPDGRRKLHGREIAVSGGVPIFIALSAGVAAGCWFWPWSINPEGANTNALVGLMLGAFTICLVGLIDDCGMLRGRHKFLGQLFAISLVVACGVVIEHVRILDWNVELGLLAVPFTFFFLLGAVNSLNLIDGMDGLLSTVGVIVTLAFGVIAVLSGHTMAAGVAFVLAGAILGFLRYNLPPATVFLGDAGSMLIGLIVGVLAILSNLKGPATVALAAPVAILIIPIFDTAAAIIRRRLTGRSIYSTDRSHLHHCLMRRGMTTGWTLCVIASFCLLTVAGALVSAALNNELFALISAGAVVGILVIARLFGRAEINLVHQRVKGFAKGILQGRANSPVHEMAVNIHGSLPWKEFMESVALQSGPLNLQVINLDVNAPAINESYHAHWSVAGERGEEAGLWRTEIPLKLGDQCIGRLEIHGMRDDEPIWRKMSQIVEMVHAFEARVLQWTIERQTVVPPARPVVSAAADR
jgi:UDP-GlcNAc:undecaprenyl-phosphate/decaprenyl-phosphate GlcNAc-1-phosphate transferase